MYITKFNLFLCIFKIEFKMLCPVLIILAFKPNGIKPVILFFFFLILLTLAKAEGISNDRSLIVAYRKLIKLRVSEVHVFPMRFFVGQFLKLNHFSDLSNIYEFPWVCTLR